jgi:hypothetical protein
VVPVPYPTVERRKMVDEENVGCRLLEKKRRKKEEERNL